MSLSLFGATTATVLALGACAAGQVTSPPIADGVFDDWSPSGQIATDPAGDASGGFDLTELWAQNDGTVVNLRFTTAPVGGSELNLQSGDAADGTLVFRFQRPGGASLSVDLRARRLFENDNTGNTVSWSAAGYHTAPTHSAREFELRVDLGVIGAGVGETIDVSINGSDQLSGSASFVLSSPATTPARRSADKDPGALFRIASINTRSTGLLNSTRGPRISRLVDAMNAEIVCFQEEYNSSAADVAGVLESIDPLGTGAPWLVEKVFDNVVAVDSSVASLIPVPSSDNSHAAAVVDFGGGDAVVVFSIHPKCCGSIASTEDTRRIDQMNLLIGTLNDLRADQLGAQLSPYVNAPAIVIGDWNLVGSRIPLDMLEDPTGPALTTTLLRGLIGDETVTWEGSSMGAGSFAPGRLDLVAHDPGLNLVKSFLLDTAQLNSSELAALGLQSGDSQATDHRMLVTDFSTGVVIGCVGDADGNGIVNFDDLTSVLANWLTPGPSGDANADGIVNFDDVTEVLSNWLATCI